MQISRGDDELVHHSALQISHGDDSVSRLRHSPGLVVTTGQRTDYVIPPNEVRVRESLTSNLPQF
ncbi:MAG: hypothetical protein HRU09_12325 [Oligoflexales bacterium]|nr:hypothetical protein [Oligoflexales bacterium]